ncbi:hypothetical protein DV532_27295 (plasmid) [Pseudomonas sp. Leaf58]|uniref:hypothetical protein n=1 Tax=Pseudomonas sp. Leaf58 TaxID=1736226 RepID=UPI0006F901ED|nr:hypothetical protein [Pseudomonas sp. Leaf58]AYG47989.1 hypothetical protein DV532_27295 [Pseudomonas sp. Leaf58]KQN62451.1 hypothetical protein ASF02_09890 [Pseudomonas sp. Leaf58]
MTSSVQDTNLLTAPFPSQAVQALNTFQTHTSGGFLGHPYTCANRGDGYHGEEGGDLGVLIATEEGGVCPHCSYTQQTAHKMMVDTGSAAQRDVFRGLVKSTQLRDLLKQRIDAYQALQTRHPAAPGVAVMLMSLRGKWAQLGAESAE